MPSYCSEHDARIDDETRICTENETTVKSYRLLQIVNTLRAYRLDVNTQLVMANEIEEMVFGVEEN